MNPRGDMQYFFQLERMVIELQLHAALRRAAGLRARAAKQKDFACAQQVTQFEQILLQSQRQLSKLHAPGSPVLAVTQSKAGSTAEMTGRSK